MAADLAPDPAAAARLRGVGARALIGAAGALPGARCGRQHPRRVPHDPRAVLPPASPPGAACRPAAAHRDDPQVAPAPAGGALEPLRPDERSLPLGPRRRPPRDR